MMTGTTGEATRGAAESLAAVSPASTTSCAHELTTRLCCSAPSVSLVSFTNHVLRRSWAETSHPDSGLCPGSAGGAGVDSLGGTGTLGRAGPGGGEEPGAVP